MDIQQILQHLPHRYPFLLIDRVTEFTAGESLVGYKNVTYNEPFFLGHFPERPAFRTVERGAKRESLYFLVGIDKARFKKPVEPGDQLELRANLIRAKRGIWVFACESRVDDKVVATAEIMCTEQDINT
jgi:3-hydroxyacyl-[acyl-carrier-protein] dehydratase